MLVLFVDPTCTARVREVLETSRLRWQIELNFKRLLSITAHRECHHLLQLRHTNALGRENEAGGHAKALASIKKMSRAAWRAIHLNGHYTLRGDGKPIDLDAAMAGLDLA